MKTENVIFKEMDFTSRIIEIIEIQMTDNAMTTSDMQGAVQAIIKTAIAYGRTLD